MNHLNSHSRGALLATLALALGLAPMVAPATTAAQPAPVEQLTETHVEEAPSDDTTSLAASVGGSLNTGNTQAWQVNAGSDFLLVRGANALTAGAKFAFGRANLDVDENGSRDGYKDTVKNFNAKLRYDRFLTDYDALFAATALRWDTFAGLDARVQGQLGYLRMFFREPNHRFWGELGYDITYDNFDPDPLLDDDGNVLDGTQVVHAARAFLGYDNQLRENITYLGGLEALINVEDPEDTRINFDNALRSSIGGNLQLELRFTLQFDNVPVPGALKLDTATVASLIYTMI